MSFAHNSGTTPLAVIFGLSGLELTDAEADFFRTVNPLGFILFARNIDTPEQVKQLCQSLRECVGRGDAPILIDQEGGKVARLKPPHWRMMPPLQEIGRMAEQDIVLARKLAFAHARLIAEELYELGITIDCAPVLDLSFAGAHDVIGNRSYSANPDMVADLAAHACAGFLAGGVLPILKHIPGHGRALADSHLELPVVTASRHDLEMTDFLPFKRLNTQPWAMVAHVRYDAIDPDLPATISEKIVTDILRGFIGFDGVLIADDVSMEALQGSLAERAAQTLAAGMDVTLHCNGNLDEMRAIAAAIPGLTLQAIERIERAEKMRVHSPFDHKEALMLLESLSQSRAA